MSDNNRKYIFGDISYYLKDLNKCKILTHEETVQLHKKFKNESCQASQALLCESYMVLTFSIAKRFSKYNFHIHDLLSEAHEGLLKAIDNWNPLGESRLSTYVTTCVTNQLKTYTQLNSNGIVKMAKRTATQYKIIEEMPTNTDVDELVKVLKVKRKRVLELLDSKCSRNFISISESPKEIRTLFVKKDTLPKRCKTDIQNILRNLRRFDRNLIAKYYGLNTKRQNLEELGRQLNIPAKKVKQQVIKILESLKEFDKPWIESRCVKCEDKFYREPRSKRNHCYECKKPRIIKGVYGQQLVYY
jgi:RNA polymerase sigma factor (sigma-70 family)